MRLMADEAQALAQGNSAYFNQFGPPGFQAMEIGRRRHGEAVGERSVAADERISVDAEAKVQSVLISQDGLGGRVLDGEFRVGRRTAEDELCPVRLGHGHLGDPLFGNVQNPTIEPA